MLNKQKKGGMNEGFLKRVRRGNQKEKLFRIWEFKMLNRTIEDEGLLQLGLRFLIELYLIAKVYTEEERRGKRRNNGLTAVKPRMMTTTQRASSAQRITISAILSKWPSRDHESVTTLACVGEV